MAFRDLIVHNFRRKLFALVLAILIWFTIRYSGHEQQGAGKTGQPPPTNSFRGE